MNILITGTSSGLGYGLAKHYLQNGAKVWGISRSENKGLNAHSEFTYLKLDLSDFEAINIKLPVFINGIEPLDLVILNAGMLSPVNDLHDTPYESIKPVMKLNVWANKIIIDILFSQVKTIEQVVGISSGASVSGSRGFNAYALSKATLNAMLKTYAGEFTDTHFTALAPGLIDSKMQDYIYSQEDVEKFPALKKLQEAKGTDQMPGPEKAAEIVSAAIRNIKTSFESGQFLDVRKI